MTYGYLLDGTDLSTYGISVTRVRGALDFLQRKTPTKYSWPDADGIDGYTGATDIYFEPRRIRVGCAIQASSATDLKTKINALRLVLEDAGTHTLTLPYWSDAFTVMYEGGDEVEPPRKWTANALFVQFTLTFIEVTPSRAS